MTGLDSPSEKENAADLCSWESLLDFHRELLKSATPPDALKIRRLADARSINLPTWFLGSIRAAEKLSKKHPLGSSFIASTEAAEMASRKEVAQTRFQLLKSAPQRAFFPACGSGLDLIHFCELHKDSPVIFSDLEKDHLKMSQSNLELAIDKSDAKGVCHDVKEMPFDSPFSYTFLDPARRKGNEKLFIDTMEPPLEDCLALAHSSEAFQIKLPAGFNPDRDLPQEFADMNWQWDWIQYGRDVLECVGTLQSETDHHRGVHLIETKTADVHSWATSDHSIPGFIRTLEPKVGEVITIPEPVIHSAGILDHWAHHHNLIKTPWPEILLSSQKEFTQLSNSYLLEARCRPHLKDIFKKFSKARHLKIGPLSRSARFPTPLLKDLESHNRKISPSADQVLALFVKSGKKEDLLILKAS